MKRYVVAELATGEIVRVVICLPDQAAAQARAGELVFESAAADASTHYLADASLQPYTRVQRDLKATPPVWNAAWSNRAMTWIDLRPEAERRADCRAAIEAEYVRRSRLPIEYAQARFDADLPALAAIGRWQAQIAAGTPLPPDFVWRDADNRDHPADAAFVNGLGAAIALRDSELRRRAWALKALAAEAPLSQLDLIHWN